MPHCSVGRLEYRQAKQSAIMVLQIFIFIWHCHPTTLYCWMLSQQVHHAAMFVIADSWQTANYDSIQLVEDTLAIFGELERSSVQAFASVAVELLKAAISRLGAHWQERHMERHMQPPT